MPHIEIIGIGGLPEIEPGADLAALTAAAIARQGQTLRTGDLVVVTQKIVSKAEGCEVPLREVEPSALATAWADTHGKDPRMVELALREATRIVRMDRGVLITETRHGLVCANSGVDASNARPGHALLLPRDPDASARALCERLRAACGVEVGVVISDTFGRPWREGQVNVAIGLAGVRAVDDHRGRADVFGRTLSATVVAVADEVASAAELVMGKTTHVPIALVRGLDLTGDDPARALVRPADADLFR